MRITVLGTGMVGSAIAKDLAEEKAFDVRAVDVNETALQKLASEPGIESVHADLREKKQLNSVVADADLVISGVPGFMGFETLKRIIESGKDVVDIAFFGENPLALDSLAKENGVTAVVDCGVAPGLCNIQAGYVFDRLDRTDRYVCYVGGLPRVRRWPFEYKAVFSPADVLEEYIRPARFIENGEEIVLPALSGIELIDFPEVGTLEAFNTDGLRTLRDTLPIPFMREKTCRYPGHAELMRVFRESGFFSNDEMDVDGNRIKPMALTSRLLFDQWQLQEGEVDFTVMKVQLDGLKDGKRTQYTYNLYDRYDEATRTTSMARTTGYTCSIVARQIVKGLFKQKGVCPPEFIGRTDGCYEDLLKEYEKRIIHVEESVCPLG
jgi:saccharopine dehydrogenase-like NADP-dependent oxidoreductase